MEIGTKLKHKEQGTTYTVVARNKDELLGMDREGVTCQRDHDGVRGFLPRENYHLFLIEGESQ